MELMFIAYLYGLIPEIKGLLWGLIIIVGVVVVLGPLIIILCQAFKYDMGNHSAFKDTPMLIKRIIPFKILIVSILVLSVVKTLIPTQDTVKWMVGAYVASLTVDGIKNIEGIDKLPDNAVKYMNNFLSEFENKVEESVDKVNQSK